VITTSVAEFILVVEFHEKAHHHTITKSLLAHHALVSILAADMFSENVK
jgi:hypothetical protein